MSIHRSARSPPGRAVSRGLSGDRLLTRPRADQAYVEFIHFVERLYDSTMPPTPEDAGLRHGAMEEHVLNDYLLLALNLVAAPSKKNSSSI